MQVEDSIASQEMNGQVPLRIRRLLSLKQKGPQRHLTRRVKLSDAAKSSDAVGPSASAMIDDEAGPFISRDATLFSTCNHCEKAESSYQPASTWEAGSEGQLCMAVIYTHLYVRLLSTMSRQYAHYCVLILNFQWLFIIYNIT